MIVSLSVLLSSYDFAIVSKSNIGTMFDSSFASFKFSYDGCRTYE